MAALFRYKHSAFPYWWHRNSYSLERKYQEEMCFKIGGFSKLVLLSRTLSLLYHHLVCLLVSQRPQFCCGWSCYCQSFMTSINRLEAFFFFFAPLVDQRRFSRMIWSNALCILLDRTGHISPLHYSVNTTWIIVMWGYCDWQNKSTEGPSYWVLRAKKGVIWH